MCTLIEYNIDYNDKFSDINNQRYDKHKVKNQAKKNAT